MPSGYLNLTGKPCIPPSRKGVEVSKKARDKMSEKQMGHPFYGLRHWTMSEETKRKHRERMKGKAVRGYGWHHSKETKRKIKESNNKPETLLKQKMKTGEKSQNWKGGKEVSEKIKKEKREIIAGRPKPEQCEICGAFGKIYFDHDHKTGKFRGWICPRCNWILGLAKDSKDLLNMLINYLNKNNI